ncbi:MAG: hypothetical protein AAFO15_01090 [Pseudomonadota bacterium]
MQVYLTAMNIEQKLTAIKIKAFIPFDNTTEGGDIEILPNHENMIFTTQNTHLYIMNNQNTIKYAVGDCVITIQNNNITITSNYIIPCDTNSKQILKQFEKLPEKIQNLL